MKSNNSVSLFIGDPIYDYDKRSNGIVVQRFKDNISFYRPTKITANPLFKKYYLRTNKNYEVTVIVDIFTLYNGIIKRWSYIITAP